MPQTPLLSSPVSAGCSNGRLYLWKLLGSHRNRKRMASIVRKKRLVSQTRNRYSPSETLNSIGDVLTHLEFGDLQTFQNPAEMGGSPAAQGTWAGQLGAVGPRCLVTSRLQWMGSGSIEL